jgi:hypothetical protein
MAAIDTAADAEPALGFPGSSITGEDTVLLLEFLPMHST